MTVKPTRIRVDREARLLVLDWSDGIRTSFPWRYLREMCPSAGERELRANPPTNPLHVLQRIPNDTLTDLRLVGNYALQPTWGDGHSVGIYTWPHLRDLARDPRVLSGPSPSQSESAV